MCLLPADGGVAAMPRNDQRIRGQIHELAFDGGDDFFAIAAGQIGSSNGVAKQGVARYQLVLLRYPDADASGRMAWGFSNLKFSVAKLNDCSVFGWLIYFCALWILHADPGGLHVQHVQQGIVSLIHIDRRPSFSAQFCRSSYVVNVRMGHNNSFHLEPMFSQDGVDIFQIIAGIDDNRFMILLVPKDGTITLQQSYRQNFVDHISTLAEVAFWITVK